MEENKWHVATHSWDLLAFTLRSREPMCDVAAKNVCEPLSPCGLPGQGKVTKA